MEQTREPLLNADAGKIVGKAVGLTQAALASDAGKAVRSAIANGSDGLLNHLSEAALKKAPDPITQAKVLLAEQSQNFDVMRGAIGQIGTSLAHLNEAEPHAQHPHATALLNAQAEAIQGLTLLVLKGQQVQGQLLAAIEGEATRGTSNGMPKWFYYIMGFSMLWTMLGMIF